MRKLVRRWRRHLQAALNGRSGVEIHDGDNFGVVYQTWGLSSSALWYIDQGYQNALSAAGHRWSPWDPNSDPKLLCQLVEEVRPRLLLLNLQTIQRCASSWCRPEIVNRLVEQKQRIGFRVACRSHPSNLADLFGAECGIDFSEFRENVRSFYQQPEHPEPSEEFAVESGLIDLYRSAFYHGAYPIAFRNFLDRGFRILEEPHAADLVAYPLESPSIHQPVAEVSGADILFVGGCWPFKLRSMKPYVEALQKRFGGRFRIYGHGWPAGWSRGVLPESEFNSTIQAAKLNLTLHELSQTLQRPISGNERVFKLGALGCTTISDANPLIHHHFDTEESVGWAANADAMVSLAEQLLEDPGQRRARALATRETVLQRHSYRSRLERISTSLGRSEQIMTYGPEAPVAGKPGLSDHPCEKAA